MKKIHLQRLANKGGSQRLLFASGTSLLFLAAILFIALLAHASSDNTTASTQPGTEETISSKNMVDSETRTNENPEASEEEATIADTPDTHTNIELNTTDNGQTRHTTGSITVNGETTPIDSKQPSSSNTTTSSGSVQIHVESTGGTSSSSSTSYSSQNVNSVHQQSTSTHIFREP